MVTIASLASEKDNTAQLSGSGCGLDLIAPMPFAGSTPRYLAGLVALSLCFTLRGEARTKATATPLTKCEQAEHALNRLTFGPRPGDVKRVEAMGAGRWIWR